MNVGEYVNLELVLMPAMHASPGAARDKEAKEKRFRRKFTAELCARSPFAAALVRRPRPPFSLSFFLPRSLSVMLIVRVPFLV